MDIVVDRKAKPALENLRINGERLWASLMELAKIGATPNGGVCRLTLTDLDRQGRDLVLKWAREAGMTLQANLAAAGDELACMTDATALEQIVFNLVDNAVRFTPAAYPF